MRRIVLVLTILPILTACAHSLPKATAETRPQPCTTGFAVLHFQPGQATFRPIFGSGLATILRVVDRCEMSEIVVAGLPDPANSGSGRTLAEQRSNALRSLFSSFGVPITFRPGSDQERAEPVVHYSAHPVQ